MYEQHYRFRETPFRLAPDPDYFFSSPAHRRALAYLRYGMARREGFIVVTGRPGTGKTTLAQALLAEARNERVVVGSLNTTHLEADDVLRMVAATFGLGEEAQPKSVLLKRLETFFAARVRAGEHVLLVVDEAQNLPHSSLEELRMLSNFQLGNHALVQIFLLGQQQFRDMLNSPELEQLRQRVVAACHLEPLNPQETRAYIEHRLRQAGWQGRPRITDLAYGMIHALSEGIPRRINAFCDRLFLYGALESLDTLDEAAVSAVHRELAGESVFDQVVLDPERIEPVPPLEEEEPTPPSGQARPDQPAAETAQQAPAEPATPADTGSESPRREAGPVEGLRERIQVYHGGGEERDGSGVRVTRLPQPESPARRALPPAATAALALYRDPKGSHPWLDPAHPLPEGVGELLQIALGHTEDYAESAWAALGSDRGEMQDAARLFVARVLFADGADYFRNLGLGPDAREEQIREHYRLLFRLLQPVDGAEDPQWSRKQVKTVNRAYNTLRNEERRQAYLHRLHQAEQDTQPVWAQEPPAAPQETQAPANGEETARAGGAQAWIWGGVILALVLVGLGLYFTLGQERPVSTPASAVPPAKTQAPILRQEERPTPVPAPPLDADRVSHGRTEAPTTLTPGPGPMAAGEEREGRAGAGPAPSPSPSEAPSPRRPRPTPARQGPIAAAGSQEKPVEVPAKPRKVQSQPLVKSREVEPQPPAAAHAGPQKMQPAAPTPATPLRAPAPEPTPSGAETTTVVAEGAQADMAAVETPRPTPAKAVATPAAALSLPALQSLMNGLFQAYAKGDLEAFMSHFAPNAFTNDQTNLEGIRRDYQQLFEATSERRMQADLSWELLDERRARGEGRFMVSVLPKGAREARIVTGTLVVQVVVDETGRPRIGGLFHTYDRAR